MSVARGQVFGLNGGQVVEVPCILVRLGLGGIFLEMMVLSRAIKV